MPRQIKTKLRFLVLGIGLTVMAAYPAPTQVVQPSAVDAAYVPTLTFDVASVKEDDPASRLHQGFRNPLHSSLYVITDFWPYQLVAHAYANLALSSRSQIVGGPDWVSIARFTIEAKSGNATDARLAKLTDDQAKLEKQHMLLMLLEDRFKLRAHVETRDLPGYALTIPKNGSKLQEVAKYSATPGNKDFVRTGSQTGWDGDKNANGLELDGLGVPISQLIGQLDYYLNAQVIDQTGLKGYYEFKLQFQGKFSGPNDDNPSAYPPAEVALPEQLGLKLTPAKVPVKVVVIDHIEKPSPN